MSDLRRFGNRFSVYGRMTARSGQRDALIKHFADVLEPGVPGLESCTITAAFDDPDTIWLTQIWTDKNAHDVGTSSEPLVTASKRVMSLLAEPPQGSYGEVACAYTEFR